jgi:protein phosphatase
MVLRPEIDFAGRQIVGRRARQEDYYAFELLEGGDLLLAVADGVGGHVAGQVASETAVHGFFDGFHRVGDSGPSLTGALELASARLAEAVEHRPDKLTGMGTTLVGVHLSGDAMRWISVGDSPLFLLRGGVLARLNADHSARILGEGSHIPGSILFSALTGGPIPAVDFRSEPFPLMPGDILLAATDGILVLTGEEIATVMAEGPDAPMADRVRALLDAVTRREHPRQDNTTVALVRVTGDGWGGAD